MNKLHRYNQALQFEDKRHEALMGLWWTGVLLKKQANAFFKKTIASEAQFNVLMALRYSPERLTQNQLSERLLVDKSNITGLVDRMEKAKLLRRIAVPGDRRCYHLELTKGGNQILDQIEQPYLDLVHRLMSIFSDDEVAQITSLAERLQDKIIGDNNEKPRRPKR